MLGPIAIKVMLRKVLTLKVPTKSQILIAVDIRICHIRNQRMEDMTMHIWKLNLKEVTESMVGHILEIHSKKQGLATDTKITRKLVISTGFTERNIPQNYRDLMYLIRYRIQTDTIDQMHTDSCINIMDILQKKIVIQMVCLEIYISQHPKTLMHILVQPWTDSIRHLTNGSIKCWFLINCNDCLFCRTLYESFCFKLDCYFFVCLYNILNFIY